MATSEVIDLTFSDDDQDRAQENVLVDLTLSDDDDEDVPLSSLSSSRRAAFKRLTQAERLAVNAEKRRRRKAEVELAKAFARRQRAKTRSSGQSSVSKPQPRARARGLLLPPNTGTLFPDGAEILDRPPSPPPIDPVHPPRGRGMKPFDYHLIHTTTTTSGGCNLPFSVGEIPSFNRKTWGDLNSHRYIFESSLHYPCSVEAQASLVVSLKKQLLQLLREDGWKEGEEPDITFPRVEGVLHNFVDIRYKTKNQHAKGRDPRPTLRAQCDPITPWQHTAWVDRQWIVIQFSHPSPTAELDINEMVKFYTHFQNSIPDSPLEQLGIPHSAYVLPNGFPHNTDFIPTNPPVEHPEYILIFHNPSNHNFFLPPYLQLNDGGKGEYVKLWWNHRPDLCDYCKDSLDGHLNPNCTRKNKRKKRYLSQHKVDM